MLDKEKEVLKEIKIRDTVHKETIEHSIRVGELALKFGTYLKLSIGKIENLYKGALLHDIGKFFINEKILYKKDILNQEEWLKIKGHPQIGYEYIKKFKFNKDVEDIILQHHERIDKNGYPFRLNEENINYLSKIVAILDVYDALINKRSYKDKMDYKKVKEILCDGIGIQFNEKILLKFIEFMESNTKYIDNSHTKKYNYS